ncbi:MAG TPA: HAMP domain-containing protein [Bacteroidetes bacterium]|nr:HAMP domain-containing protein [Bacteroidota bacterium]
MPVLSFLKFSHKLITRLLASHLLLVIIPLLLAGQILIHTANSSIEQTITRRNHDIARRAASQIERTLQHVSDILAIVARTPEIYEMGKLRQELLLDNILISNPVFKELFIVDTQGRILVSTAMANVSEQRSELGRPENIRRILAGEVVSTEVFILPESGPMMDMGERILDTFDQPVGALCGRVNLKELWALVDDLVDSKVLGETGAAFIVRADGRYIAHTDRQKVLAVEHFPEGDILRDILRGHSDSRVYTLQSGMETILAYAPIAAKNWGIILQQPTREAFATAREMRNMIFMLMLGSLAVASLIAFFYTRNILRPVDRLIDGINRISRGDLYHRIEPLGKDEISQLAEKFNDMSARLRNIQNQLKRTERLETLGKLASVLSHEIRNPLNSMVINMQIMRREYRKGDADTKKLDHYHKVVVSEVERVDDLVSNFLMIARPPKLELEECRLAEIIDEVLAVQQPVMLTQGIRSERRYKDENLRARVDRKKLKQVFLNILINAAQAMSGGGKLIVFLEKTISYDPEGKRERARIVFKDTGKGIPKEQQQKIFDFYYSTKADGTGIGLSLALQIIEEHGGDIKINSEENKGTEVIIYLPIVG